MNLVNRILTNNRSVSYLCHRTVFYKMMGHNYELVFWPARQDEVSPQHFTVVQQNALQRKRRLFRNWVLSKERQFKTEIDPKEKIIWTQRRQARPQYYPKYILAFIGIGTGFSHSVCDLERTTDNKWTGKLVPAVASDLEQQELH